MNIYLPWTLLLENIFWAGIAALGFAILFNVPKRTLIACAVSGALAYGVRIMLMQFGLMGIEAATFMGAMAVSFLAIWFGRRWHAPAPVFSVPGVIPLVPGALAFRTMVDIVTLTTGAIIADEALLLTVVISGLKTILILFGIAAGVAVPSLLLRRHQPMT
jgi:uncharacterized membrane protein YjjB (DUF3815 family)